MRISTEGFVVHRFSEIGDALFSPDEAYRYVLRRRIYPTLGAEPERAVAFVMLNPSVADEKVGDQTIRRCTDYASRWGYSELYVVNLFAYRSTSPANLYKQDDPIGPLNDHYIEEIAQACELVVMAWGAHGNHLDRSQVVREKLRQVCKPHYLVLTKEGEPGHPLRLRKDLKPTEAKTIGVHDAGV